MNTCPIGCGRNKMAGKLLCYPCWCEVPTELQKDVYRTWRKYVATDVHSADFAEISRAYRAARDAALASIR